MTSIKDVANLAGVGLGTASRALSGKGYVAHETKKRIEEAAKKLSYKPNVLAQNLLKNSSGIIGILIPTLDYRRIDSVKDYEYWLADSHLLQTSDILFCRFIFAGTDVLNCDIQLETV